MPFLGSIHTKRAAGCVWRDIIHTIGVNDIIHTKRVACCENISLKCVPDPFQNSLTACCTQHATRLV